MSDARPLPHLRRSGALLILRHARYLARLLQIKLSSCEWNLGMTLSGVLSHRLDLESRQAAETIFFSDADLIEVGQQSSVELVESKILNVLERMRSKQMVAG